jgi:N-glycosylase/DNA lyase
MLFIRKLYVFYIVVTKSDCLSFLKTTILFVRRLPVYFFLHPIMASWRSLRVTPREFTLRNTFLNGQCWCWNQINENKFCGVIGHRVVVFQQKERDVEYQVLTSSMSSSTSSFDIDDDDEAVRSFLQLETNMEPLKQRWVTGTEQIHLDMAQICNALPGMRVLRQDPLECLFSFMTSANNNISRIGHILTYWRVKWGEHLLTTNVSHDHVYTRANDPNYDIDVNQYVNSFVHYKPTVKGGKGGSSSSTVLIDTEAEEKISKDKVHYFAFPSLEKLCTLTIDDLKAENNTGCGLGYRAKTTIETIKMLQQKSKENDTTDGRSYLYKIQMESSNVSETLQQFPGVGPKVADCVSLYSLNQHSLVPTDTHVENIAEREFGKTDLYAKCKSKSLTPAKRLMINQCFINAFGAYAGWAHCLLFAAELEIFKEYLPNELVQRNINFKTKKRKLAKSVKNDKIKRSKNNNSRKNSKKIQIAGSKYFRK